MEMDHSQEEEEGLLCWNVSKNWDDDVGWDCGCWGCGQHHECQKRVCVFERWITPCVQVGDMVVIL
eukprot:645477-Rhodomonas_salina.4